MEKELRFPKDFLWGAAVSAYQVEGGINCDWTRFFDAKKACNHYNLYEKDFDLMEKLNLNAFRFSIEWSRIEPKEGRFDEKEIEHYRKYLKSLKRRGFCVMLTLHHFTNPVWFSELGGWESKKAVFYFLRFSKKIFNEYCDLVDFWITINEPMIYNSLSFFTGRWPPKKKNPISFLRVFRNQISAHKKVYQIFHKEKESVKVGISKNNQYFEPYSESFLDRISVFFARYFWNHLFFKKIKNHLDFIGLNYYFHNKIQFPFKIRNENKIVSDLGWEVYALGIYYVLGELKKYKLPIFITENGIADKKDKLRKQFIKEHLIWILRAIKEGINVKGYFYWSLIDNFEWDLGTKPCFGLIKIDYKSFKRSLRKSGFYYSKISKENYLAKN